MELTAEESALFERLRTLRNSIYDPSCYYNNDTLFHFATTRPMTKRAVIGIDASEDKFLRFGEAFLALIRTRDLAGDPSPLEDVALSYLRRSETSLYRIVQNVLQREFTADWWFQGIPEAIRVKAARLHEESRGVVPREYGLMLIDLKEIVLKKWRLFSFLAEEQKEDKGTFERALLQLNDIRNRLCHPLRLLVQPITAEDADFVCDRYTKLAAAEQAVIKEEEDPF